LAVSAYMTTVGLIGSGRIGTVLAKLSVAAGYAVLLSNSRGPQTLGELAAEVGAQAVTPSEAATADLVVVSIPVKAYASVPPVRGPVVMDTGNYAPSRDGQIAGLDDGTLTSSELLQRQVPDTKVVKVFNNIYSQHLLHLARPRDAADRSYLPIAGDDTDAKAAVTTYLDAIGYGAVDTGSLAEGRRQQPGTPVYGAPYGPFANELGQSASAEVIRAALAAA
jgi:8-hydroxy-5-deazaflavin:NADPH oxidoreductase